MELHKTAKSNNYLSSTDIETYAKTSRRNLLDCAKKKVFLPFFVSSDPASNRRWTLTQAQVMKHMSVFKRNGVSPEDLASLVCEGHSAVCNELELFHIRELRNARRNTRSMLRYQRELSDSAKTDGLGEYYLRYLPQRYFALAPMLDWEDHAGGTKYMQLILNLIGVSQVVGWAPLCLTGSLTSISADGRSASPYAFVELAAKPEPSPTASGDVDSGCYAVFADQLSCGEDCQHCVRFGRPPTNKETFAWKARERVYGDRLFNRTVLSSNLEAPYTCGAWSAYTHAACGISLKDGDPSDDKYSVLPRLMPHEIRLPYGTTACIMPAGIYLCSQHDEQSMTRATELAAGLARALPRHPVTHDDELMAHERLCKLMEPLCSRASKKVGGLGETPVIGDSAVLGKCGAISREDFSHLAVLENAALHPEDGYCITCAELPPLKTSDRPRYETQILVNVTHNSYPPPQI